MSNVLDDNVVILRFDNSDFEKNTKQSMDTLDKLKQSVNNTSGESLDGLSKAANKVNLSGLGKAIDTINNRFSNMGIVGMAAINKLTSSAMSSVSKIATAIPRQMIQGGWNRALNIERAEFLMKGLGVAFEGSFTAATETAEEKIEGVKGAVLAAVNKTRYGLDEAAKAAATLMASNEDLKKDHVQLANRLRAISGVAAVTSSEFSDISYIFTKVAGQGKMMTNELNMLSMKGFNAAVEIQKYLNQNGKIKDQALDNAIAMGKQTKKMEEIRKHAELTEGDVRDMVSAGAIDFDIMSDSLLHFFETASGANDTYEGSLANVKASFSRMGAQFEATKLKNLTKVFNYLLPVLQKFEDFIKPFTDRMNQFSDTVTDFIGEAIINPLGKAMGLKKGELFPGVKEAVEETAKGVSDSNKKNQQSSAKTRKEILALNKEYQASRDIWYKGKYGTGARRKNALEQLGISYKETQKIINQFYDDGFKWDKIEDQLVEDYKKRSKASEDAANATSEANTKQTKQYPTMVALIKGFINILAAAKLALEGVGNILRYVGGKLKDALLPGLKTGTNGFASLSEKILEVAKRFNEWTKIFKEKNGFEKWSASASLSVQNFLGIANRGFTLLKTVFTGSFSVIKEFFSQLSESDGFLKLVAELRRLKDTVLELGNSGLKRVLDQFDRLSGMGSGSNMTRIVDFFSRLAGGLADMISEVRRGENPLRGFIDILGTVKDSLSFKSLKSHGISAGVNALSAKNGTVAMIVNAAKALKGVDVKETFGKASDSIFNFFDGLTSKVKKVDIGGKLKAVFDALKNADWKEISKIAFYFGSLAAIIKTVRDAGRLVDAAVGTLGSISGMFKSIANVADTYAAQVKAQNFQLIAISVAILIGSMIALAAVPADKLKPAVASVVIVLGMLAGIMALMTKKLDPTAAYQVGAAFAAMGASMLLIATACKVLAGIDGAGMLKAGVAIIGFMAMMAVVSKMSRSLFSSGVVFISMAAAVNMLVVAVMAFAIIPWNILLKGAAAIAIFITELAIGARIAGSANATGLLAMAAALNILIPAIILFSMMPLEKALKGATIACGIIAMIGLAARIAGDSAKNTLSVVSLAAMVTALTASMVILSMIDTKRLITAASALTATMLSLAAAAKFASTAKTGLALMSLAIGMITASIIALIKIDPQAAIKIANSLTLLAVGLGVAFSLFGKLGIKGNLIGAGGLTLAIGVITGIVAALGKLYESDKARQLMSNGKEMAQMLGDAIGAFFGGIVSSFGVAATSGLGTMAENISAFSTKIKPFLTMVTGVDTKAVQGAKGLADAIFQLTKADFVESLSVFSGVENLATRMEELGTGFTKFSTAVESIPEGTVEKANTAAEVVKTLASAFGEIPKTGGKLQWFTGEADIEGFIGGIINVAKALGSNGKASGLAELDIPDDLLGENGKITKIAQVIRTMAAAAKKIPETGGLVQKITGEHDIVGMAKGILGMATVLGSNQEGLNSLATIEIPDGLTAEDGKITKICEVIAAMSTAAELIPESAGAKQLILGNTTINEFATQLSSAIPGLSQFINAVASANFTFDDAVKEKVLRVAEAIGAMGEAADKIPESGISLESIVFGGSDVSDFANELALAIPGIQTFSEGLGKVTFAKGIFGSGGTLNKVVEAIKAMALVADALPREHGWVQKLVGEKDLGSFGSQLKVLLESLDEVKGVTIDHESLQNAAKALDAITPSIQTFKGATPIPTGANLAKLGQNAASFAESLGNANTKNLASNATAIKSAASKMGAAAKSGAASLGKTAGFSSAGSSLGGDFVKGLAKSNSAAKSAGSKLAKQAKSGAGSVDLKGVGKDIGQGFVNGILAKKDEAYKSGKALGYQAKKGAKNEVDSSSPAKEFIKIGKFVGEGFVLGMKAYERKVYKQGEDIGEMSIMGTNQGITDAIDGLMDPVITPVVDLSKVDRGLSALDNEFSRNRALGINSTFESADSKNTQMMNDMINAVNKMNDNKQPSSNYFTFNVDGAENPEDFAKRFVRQVQLELRTG